MWLEVWAQLIGLCPFLLLLRTLKYATSVSAAVLIIALHYCEEFMYYVLILTPM